MVTAQSSALRLWNLPQRTSRRAKIVLATDASSQPGVDVAALLSRLRALGVTVDTILSGDCTGSLRGGPTSQSSAAIADSSQVSQSSQKPGGDDPPQGPIGNPGQSPFDDHGDTQATATHLIAGQPPVRGVLAASPETDTDLFRISLQAGRAVGIDVIRDGGDGTVELLDRDGVSSIASVFLDVLPQRIPFTPGVTGDDSLRVAQNFSAQPTVYSVALRDDVFVGPTRG